MSDTIGRTDSEERREPADRLKVVYRPITELRLDPRNPRTHSRKQIRQIARSIRVFGFNVPVLVDADLNVIVGHGRVLGCQVAGWQEIPTIELAHLTAAQVRAFMIADNKLTENSEWDDRLLAEQLKELSELNLDFSLETTGFEMAEIDLRIEGLKPEPVEDPADRQPAPGPAVSRTGDLWLLDQHRVLCGSALDEATYAGLLEKQRAAMVFIDPPYNLRIEGNVSGLGAVRHRDFKMASGDMDANEFTAFLRRAFELLACYSRDGSIHFVCMDWRHCAELLTAGGEVYSEFKNLCIWIKDNAGMGSFYRSRHELVFVFKHGRSVHRNNIQLGRFGRNRTNVWEYPNVTSFGKSGEEGNLLASHPTVKPVAMVADAILDASARGDIIIDSFLGSGTAVIAAERTGRRCYGLEVDPVYADTVVRRWQAFTGASARHAISGKLFSQIEMEVEEHHGG